MKPNGIDNTASTDASASCECATQCTPASELKSKNENVPNIGMYHVQAAPDLNLSDVELDQLNNLNKLVRKSNAVIELPGHQVINRKFGIVATSDSNNAKKSHPKLKAEDVGLHASSIHLVVPSTSAIIQSPQTTSSSGGIVSSSSNNVNVTVTVSSAKYSQIIPTSQVAAILPPNSTIFPSSTSASQTRNITAFVAPVQNAQKSVPSSCRSSALNSSQQPVIHSAPCGAKILISTPPSLVNGQMRQNVLPVVCTASGTTIILAQGSSVLSVPKTITQTSNINAISTCINVAKRKNANSPPSYTAPYSPARTSTLPIGTLSITDSLGQFLRKGDGSLSLTKPALSTVTFSNLPHVLPISSSKRGWQGSTHHVNKTNVNTKQKCSPQPSAVHSVSSSSHRYYGLPYQVRICFFFNL